MKRTSLLAVAATVAILPTATQAQNVTEKQQDFGFCYGARFSSFGTWAALTSGRACDGGLGKSVEFTYGDPYFSGSGTFLELVDGHSVVRSTEFSEHVPLFTDHRGYGPNSNNGINGNHGNGNNGINGNHGDGNNGINGNHGDGNNGINSDNANNASNGNNGSNGSNGSNGNNGNNGNNGGNGGNGGASTDANVEALVNEVNAAPEPATLLLVASGLGGVGALARRRRNAAAKNNA